MYGKSMLSISFFAILLISAPIITVYAETPKKLSGEFQINTYTESFQRNPSASSLSGGGFVVAWESDGQDGSQSGIFGQLFDSSGGSIGSEFQVNTFTLSWQLNPSVAGLSGSGFVVTWQASGIDGSAYGVFGQLFDSSGGSIGSEFQVNTYTTDQQLNPSVAALSGGGFVVTWESNGQDGSGYGVYGQMFDSSGNKNGSEFQVNSITNASQISPSVAAFPGGGFVVTWASSNLAANYNVRAQLFDSDGNKNGSEFLVNTYTTLYQRYPSVAAVPGVGFVVAWQSYDQDGSFEGVYGQMFDSSGNKNGSEFQVNTYTAESQTYPSVVGLADGRFVVTWQSSGQDSDGWGVYGQLFNADGSMDGSEFQVNSYTSSHQWQPSVTALSENNFVVTWQSDMQDGSDQGIYGQLYEMKGNAMPWVPLLLLDE